MYIYIYITMYLYGSGLLLAILLIFYGWEKIAFSRLQYTHTSIFQIFLYVPWSKVAILGMVIPPLIGILIMGNYINPYYWVDDHPLLYRNNGSLDPGTYDDFSIPNIQRIWDFRYPRDPKSQRGKWCLKMAPWMRMAICCRQMVSFQPQEYHMGEFWRKYPFK